MDVLPVLIASIIAFTATLSAGIFVKRFRANIGLACAFSGGCLLALALFDMMPDILTLAPQVDVTFEWPFITAIAGFFLVFSLDRGLFRTNQWHHTEIKKSHRSTIGILSTFEFCSHGYLEGLAIGLGFSFQFGLGIVVAIAVISHDFCDGLSTLTLMLNSGNTEKSSLKMLFIDAIAPIAGAATSLLLAVQNYFLIFAFSFLAGSFLYIGAGNLLPEAYRMNRSVVTIVFAIAGLILIFLLSKLINS